MIAGFNCVAGFQLEISSGTEITEGETVRLTCSSNLPTSQSILMSFQHNQEVAYCHPFQGNNIIEHCNGWKIYRTEKNCVLEIENVTTASSGGYVCTGFLPDGTKQLSMNSVDVNVRDVPGPIVHTSGETDSYAGEDYRTHIIGLWITILLLLAIAIVIVLTVCVILKKRKYMVTKGMSVSMLFNVHVLLL